jgi:diguanylate cyclase (GGDEF)-like protein
MPLDIDYHVVYQHSRVSLWIEDYSFIRRRLDAIRAAGVTDLMAYLDTHPDEVGACVKGIEVLEVNDYTLKMFGASSLEELRANLHRVLRDDMLVHFRKELQCLWEGHMEMDMETVNYALDGTPIHTQLARSVLPGHEKDWARILISLTDISARKKAEEYLSYLGTHDVLTGLYNRGHFEQRLAQIEQAARYPASIMMIDLNGLKQANDQGGHEAGDAMIRRAAEVVLQVAGEGDVAARLGGDEFAVIFAGLDEHGAGMKLAQIKSLVETNNQFYGGLNLSLSVGVATGHGGQLEQVQKQADVRMYEDKRAHYLRLGREGDRRSG